VIDKTTFASVMGAFADRIGRAIAPPTAELYYAELSDALTTEEFVAGARVVFRTHQFNTWPAPQQFIDAAKPKPKPDLAALEAFEKVLGIMQSGGGLDGLARRLERVAALGTVVDRAYRAAGGTREFNDVLTVDVPWLRKRFVEAFTDAVAEEASPPLLAPPKVAALAADVAKTLGSLPSTRERQLPPGDRSDAA
jgi:hypothetical protein